MELKCPSSLQICVSAFSSNRTFMELKWYALTDENHMKTLF